MIGQRLGNVTLTRNKKQNKRNFFMLYSAGSASGSATFGTAKGFSVGSTPTSSHTAGQSPLSRGKSLLASLLDQPKQSGDDSVIVVGEQSVRKIAEMKKFPMTTGQFCNLYYHKYYK